MADIIKTIKSNSEIINMGLLIIFLFLQDNRFLNLNLLNNPYGHVFLCLILLCVYLSKNVHMLVLTIYIIHHSNHSIIEEAWFGQKIKKKFL